MSEIKEFSFSKISLTELKSVVSIEKRYDLAVFENWFEKNIISENDLEFLEILNSRYGENFASAMKHFSEDTLKAKFITPVLNQIDFFSPENNISDFYHENLRYSTETFCLNGFCDFYIAHGLETPEKPFFFIQEFKKGDSHSNPEPQLVAELIAGLENNKFQKIKGALTTGVIWNFVILWKDGDKYIYTISQNFDSTKLEDLKKIFQNLLFVKEEIFNLVKKEKGEDIDAKI